MSEEKYELLRAIEILREQMHQFNIGDKLQDEQRQELLNISQELDKLLNQYENLVKGKNN